MLPKKVKKTTKQIKKRKKKVLFLDSQSGWLLNLRVNRTKIVHKKTTTTTKKAKKKNTKQTKKRKQKRNKTKTKTKRIKIKRKKQKQKQSKQKVYRILEFVPFARSIQCGDVTGKCMRLGHLSCACQKVVNQCSNICSMSYRVSSSIKGVELL